MTVAESRDLVGVLSNTMIPTFVLNFSAVRCLAKILQQGLRSTVSSLLNGSPRQRPGRQRFWQACSMNQARMSPRITRLLTRECCCMVRIMGPRCTYAGTMLIERTGSHYYWQAQVHSKCSRLKPIPGSFAVPTSLKLRTCPSEIQGKSLVRGKGISLQKLKLFGEFSTQFCVFDLLNLYEVTGLYTVTNQSFLAFL